MAKTLHQLWDDSELRLFDDEITELIADEKSDGSLSNRAIIMIEDCNRRHTDLHFELRKYEEIEENLRLTACELHEKTIEADKVMSDALDNRRELEGIIKDLRQQLADAKELNEQRRITILQKDEDLVKAKEITAENKNKFEEQYKEEGKERDEQISKLESKNKDVKTSNSKLQTVLTATKQGASTLKKAMASCQEAINAAGGDVSDNEG